MAENQISSRTNAERRLATALKGKGWSFKQNQSIEGFEVDFWLPEHRLVVEVDGYTHLSDKQQQHDQYKDRVLAEKGLMVIRVTNEEIRNNLAGSLDRISGYLKQVKQLKPDQNSINDQWKAVLKQAQPTPAKELRVPKSIEEYFLDREGHE